MADEDSNKGELLEGQGDKELKKIGWQPLSSIDPFIDVDTIGMRMRLRGYG
jgi:hypothetical protein